MSYPSARDSYSIMPFSRLQEKEELQDLNDRLALYVQRVRQLAEQNNRVDTSAFLKSAKILEDEIQNLKNMYEKELEALRKEIEAIKRDKNSFQLQSSKHQQAAVDLQDRLAVETDKNKKLMDEMNMLHRRIGALEADLKEAHLSAHAPHGDLEQLKRQIDNLTRETDTWKRRYEHEQLACKEADDKLQQVLKKMDFNEQVHVQQVRDLQDRLETSTANILSLEMRLRETSKNDTNTVDLLKQVREASEAELKKFKTESEEQYNRNFTALKAQMDNDASTIEKVTAEKIQLQGSLGDLQTKIRALEGQISNLEHQKQSLENAVGQERGRAAENVRSLEAKLRQLQDALFVKMQEVSSARESSVPLKAEIEALKALLQEEEKRLQLPVGVTTAATFGSTSLPSSYVPTSTTPYYSTAAPVGNTYPTDYLPPTLSPAYPVTATPTLPATAFANFDPVYSSSLPNFEEDSLANLEYGMSSAKYTYDTSPSVNRLHVEPTPPTTPRPVGPIRAKSAPVSGSSTGQKLPLIPVNLGQGKDYFDEMFNDLQKETLFTKLRPKSSPVDRPTSSTHHDYTVATNRLFGSAIGDLRILEVHKDGKYVRLFNEGTAEAEFSGYMIQQNVGGHPVAVFRFPPRTKFPANSTITVWSGLNDHLLHNPPTDYVWKEQQKWGTGPECTTILCCPNGQAVAWTTAAHRFTKNIFDDAGSQHSRDELDDQQDEFPQDETLTEITTEMNGPRPEPVYLRREKQAPPSLTPQKHPHGSNPAMSTHPHTGQARPLMYGNDNGSHNRQSRSQTTRPDPIPGQPYAGPAAQRMGSAPLRKCQQSSQQSTVRGSGAIANKSAGTIRFGPPTPFLSPLQQEFSQAYGKESSSLVRFTA